MKPILNYLALFLATGCLQACAVVVGIFKAGMIWGIILVIGIIGVIIYLLSRGKNNG